MLRTLTKLQPRNLSTNPIDVIITPHWSTVVGKTFLQVLYKSKDYFSSEVLSTSLLKWLQKTSIDLERIVVPFWKTANGDTLLQLVCQSESCVSRISSTVMLQWLSVTPLDLSKSVVPNYITADGDTLLQLVCKSESCVSRVSSTAMLKWMTDTPLDIMKLIILNYKTADGDTLFQLVCQSESCVSRTSSMTMEKWLTNTSDDLLIAGPNWKTADGITMTEITRQIELEPLVHLSGDTSSNIIISRHWPGNNLKIVFHSELYISHVSSLNMLLWLEKTTLDLERIVISNWKTADGDSLLQLVCQSETCLSHLSSTKIVALLMKTNVDIIISGLSCNWKTSDGVTMLRTVRKLQPRNASPIYNPRNVIITPHWGTVVGKTTLLKVLYISKFFISNLWSTSLLNWLQKTTLDLERIVIPHWKTADGDTLLQLVCQSESCVSRISSTVMLKWLTDTTVDLMKLVVPNYKTADGDTLLQLACTSKSCVSRISSTMMVFWLKHTDVDLIISGLDWKTTDGVTMIRIIHQLEETNVISGICSSDNPIDVIITPHSDTTPTFQWLYKSELYISRLWSTSLIKWLQKTSLDLEKIVVPHWKTADGDTLLQLICNLKSCVSRLSSTVMLKWLAETTVDMKFIAPNLVTSDGYSLFELVCQSKSCISRISSTEMLKWLTHTTLDMELIVPNLETADGDTLLQLVCQSKLCMSCISFTTMETWLKNTNVDLFIAGLDWKTADGVSMINITRQLQTEPLGIDNAINVVITPHWQTVEGGTSLQVIYQSELYISCVSSRSLANFLQKTTVDLEKIVIPHWKTANGDTLLELVCQSESCVSRISSTVMLKWLNDTTIDYKRIMPNSETADGDTLIQLVCQSKSCMSCIPSATMENWLKNTNVDLLIAGLDWNTADGISMINIIHQLQTEPLGIDNAIDVVITPHWETVEGGTSLQVVYRSELYVSYVSSRSLSNFLQKTTVDLEKIVIPHWKSADGDTLLQLVCQSESSVSRISSTVMLKWLTETKFDANKSAILTYITADGDNLLQLVCRTKTCVSRISSTVMLKWLTDTPLDLMKLIVPNYKTADGDTLLQLVCQSELCVSCISSITMETWLKNTKVDLVIAGLDWKTADGITMIKITCLLQLQPLGKFSNSIDAIITPHWETVDGGMSLKVLYRSELYISHLSSSKLLKWLEKTPIDLEKIIIPHWKTADGNTLIELVCQSESCVARISSTVTVTSSKALRYLVCHSASLLSQITSEVILGGLNTQEFALVGSILPSWKTADGYTIFMLFCTSQCSLSNISSELMLLWLIDCDETTFDVLKSVKPDWTTADGYPFLHLLCQSSIEDDKVIQLLQYYSQEGLLNPNIRDSDGNTALHLLCKANKPACITFLLTETKCDINLKNHTELLPLEMTKNPEIILSFCQNDSLVISSKLIETWLNNTASIDKQTMFKIFKLLVNNGKLKTSDGSTLLHVTCHNILHDTMSLVHYLLTHPNCDPNCLDNNGQMPLKLTSDSGIMKTLIQHGAKVTADVVFRMISNVAEHRVSEMLLLSTKKKTMLWRPTDQNDDGDTALHLACKVDNTAVVKYLLKQGNCNPNDKNLRNEFPIELTTNLDTISVLLEQGATLTPELVLKLAAVESIPKDLLAQLIWNPDNCNSEGNTALHLACQEDQPDTVNILLSQVYCNPNIKNNKEEVPLQMTTNSEIIKDLIRYGAQTSIMYKSHRSALGASEPIKPPVKIFVVGNPSVGKSTLTAALKKKLNFLARLVTSKKVSGVDKKTVGIVPHKFESEIFGRVTVYDFAGHREFYSGHAALLQASVQSTPPIFLLVVNLCDEEDDVIQNILYWISFLENQCTLVSCKPHVIIVGSHADTLKSNGVNPQAKVDNIVHLLDPNYFINLKFISFIPMDCQLHESTGMNDFRTLLVKSCGKLRIQHPITFNAHCFLVYLLDTFKQTSAATISTIHEQVERQQLSHTKDVLDFLPKTIGALYKICLELNERGHILFLKDKTNLENSYVVIDEKSLLYEVSGTVFASKIFNQYKEVASNTGVVALSKIAECFPGEDLNILIGFLTHLEFCHEISDQALFQLISENYSPDFDERYYLFSGLISEKAPDFIWEAKSDFKYNFGWILRCIKIQQFFSSRFLEVLLLRLVFSFASTEDPKKLAIHRKCTLWMNGIFWGTHFGMDTLVEIIDNKSVIVMSRFRASNLVKCLEYRSRVLHTVLKCVQEFCPRISTVESFIDTSSNSALEYPFVLNSKTTLCTVKDLAEALVSNSEYPSVVLSGSGKSIPAEMFFSFEPYAEIESSTLQELLDKNNETKVVPDVFLSRLVEKVSKNIELMIKIFNESACIRCSKNSLIQEILNWRDRIKTEPMTYSDLRKKLDQHSIFAGRNVLNLAGRKYLSPSKVQGESAESCLRSIPPLIIVQGNTPTLHELLLLKFANGKELRIMETVAPIWQKVAATLGFDRARIQSIEMGAHYQPEDASREMFCIWLEGAHDLKPATWSTLIQSLKDVELTDIADVLSHLKIHEDKTSNQSSTESLTEPSSNPKSLGDDVKAKPASRLRYKSLQELPTGELSEESDEIHNSQQQNETESWLTLEQHRGFAGEDESDHAEPRHKVSPSLEVSVKDISTLVPKLFVQGNTPDLRELLVLEFPDGKEVRISEAVAPIWKNIAITLGFNRSKIKTIEIGSHFQPEDACLEMFRIWLKESHDLKPATWSTLIQSLKDVKLTEIADILSNLEVKDDGISNQSSTESVPVPSSTTKCFDEDLPMIDESEWIIIESLQENPMEESSKENNKQNSFQVQRDKDAAFSKGSLPKLDMKALELIEGRGGRNIKVIEDIGSLWQDLAVVLGIQAEFIDQIKNKHPSLRHHEACREILATWLEGNSDEVSWTTLTQGLITAGLPELADNLRETLRLD